MAQDGVRAKRRVKLSTRVGATIAVACAGLLVLAATVLADPSLIFGGNDNPWPYNNPGPAPVLAAVGDISCQPGGPQETEKPTDTCDQGVRSTVRDAAQNATAEQVEAMKPALVAVLGDEQYQNGYYSDFENSFDKYWGAFKFLQRPSPGNHEFYDNHGQTGVRGLGYFDYYNGIEHNADGSRDRRHGHEPDHPRAPSRSRRLSRADRPASTARPATGGTRTTSGPGTSSRSTSNAQTSPVDAARRGSWFASETAWLAQDLNENRAPCTLAYWHQPTFSSTQPASMWMQDSAEGQAADTWWKMLYAHHADLVLNGHDHVYSRFAPMDPAGNVDPRNGIREFIIGTGGESLDTLNNDNPANTPTPNLQASADQYYGVMKLTLLPVGYIWNYQSAMLEPHGPDRHGAQLQRQRRRALPRIGRIRLRRVAKRRPTLLGGGHRGAPHPDRANCFRRAGT